ncbi:ComEA family DNA-binding protein [Aurantibacillus circumpalustris]|uniref:ComEA family DNA-binding protein n=1 Tax=Aurantibacillus circumpalustris TaxID=3036359 RepID=UPI00295B3C7E|nr:helix-hairpin-helix domain-containing protein [Aurantibacillus circumpalustris]
MLQSFLNNYFGFNKQQRNGLFVLLVISFVLLLIRLTYPLFIKPDAIVLLDLPLIEKKLDSVYSKSHSHSKNKVVQDNSNSTLFVFNPNTVSLEQLKQLGFKEKTALIFLKFRKNGFVFKQKKDLQKVYGINDKLFAQLEPYILIEEQTAQPDFKKQGEQKVIIENHVKQTSIKIELNSADSASLVALNGIGASYAKRILKYRGMLGGFVTVDQLKEVYGFNDELYEKVKNLCYVDAKTIQKINLNKDDFKTINKHPYLTYENTKTIFDWRRKTTINAMNLKDILNDNGLVQKLLPYLSFE